MTKTERPNNNQAEAAHFNPAVVQWAIPEEGMSIRLQLENPGMETLSADEREKLTRLFSRLALLCDYVVTYQSQLEDGGLEPEKAFTVTTEYLKDIMLFFQALRQPPEAKPAMEEGFPF